MKHLLISATLIAFSGCIFAQENTLRQQDVVTKQLPARKEAVKVTKSRKIAKNLIEEQVETPNGLAYKRIKNLEALNPGKINPEMASHLKAPATKEGYTLYEDFEAWDGQDTAWLPDGWSVDHKDSPASDRGWKMTRPINIYDIIDSKCLTYEMFEEEVDEWLLTPQVSVQSGMQLTWGTMTSPYFYDWTYFDDKTFQLTKYEIINDITVNISTDGGKSWEQVFSHAENLAKTASSFFAMFDYTVRPFTLSLSKYVGKTIMVGFRVSGRDGNTTFIDDVSIGLPPTKTAYTRPLANLYFGLSNMDQYVPGSIMVGPVFQPVTYSNTTPKADYLWTYTDQYDETHTSTDKNLVVTYTTDYTSDFSTRNNLYNFPVLRASSATTAPVEFSFPGFYQAGGKGEYEIHYVDTDEREIIDLGLTVVDPVTEGTATYADIEVPYFGYNPESDRYWSEYTFGQGGMNDKDWVNLTKYADFFYSPASSMVIDGIRTNAYGKISRNAKFTAEIYLLGSDYSIRETPYAIAECTGDDIIIVDRYSSNDFLSLNFKFDEPIVLSKSVAPYFLVAIGGFHDAENVEYFSPEMSSKSNPNRLGLGWVGKVMSWEGTMLPYSWTPVANYTGDELVSFYIMLDATFPWLETEDEEVVLSSENTATITLDSYHHADNIVITDMPEWLTATAQGRYGETAITFNANNVPDSKPDADVTLSAPGVSKKLKINSKQTSVSNIINDNVSSEKAVYTLDGKRVKDENLQPGIYIVRQGDVTTKQIVK